METKIAILFIGKRSGQPGINKFPIYLRVTIDKKSFEAATHLHVEPGLWSPSGGRVKGKSDSAIDTNMALDMIKKKVYDYRDQLYKENREFTVNSLREKWLARIGINEPCLIQDETIKSNVRVAAPARRLQDQNLFNQKRLQVQRLEVFFNLCRPGCLHAMRWVENLAK